MSVPVYTFHDVNNATSTIHLAVANGFPPQTYAPLMRPFIDRSRVVSLLPRALWPGETPPDILDPWDGMLTRDLLQGLREHIQDPVIAIGHSFGGIASLLAVIREPERFRALILLDPTVLMPPILDSLDRMRADGSIAEFPLAARALRRQRLFDSIDTAYDYFRGKALFADWPEETLRLYAEYGTRPSEGGQGVELAWTPEWEAYYFKTGYTGIWGDLPRLQGLLPVLIIRGGESDTLVAEAGSRIRQLLPDADYHEIAEHGHLFPHTAPTETARIITEFLAQLD